MTATFEKTSTNQGVLTFEIQEDVKEKALKDAFHKIKGRLNVPGFRKGKVTRQIFDRMYGEEALYQEAFNAVFPEAYQKAIEEAGLEVVSEPELDIDEMKKGQPWLVKATVTVKPEVKLGQYEGLEVKEQDRQVSDEEVDQYIENKRAGMAELVLSEEAAKEGDTVVIDFEGFMDGEAFEGGKGENHSLELGSGSFIPGFEDQLIGKSEGDEVEVKVTFPENYGAEDLAGKEAVFNVKVHEVKTKELPALDDELAKDLDDEVASLEEYKLKVRQELQESKETQAKEKEDEEALNKALENAEIIDLPEVMVTQEVDRQMEYQLTQIRQMGMDPAMYFQMTGMTEDAMREQLKDEADKRVKISLILEEIAKKENIEVSEEDREKEIADLAKTYNVEESVVRSTVQPSMLNNDIKLKKAMDRITETVKKA